MSHRIIADNSALRANETAVIGQSLMAFAGEQLLLAQSCLAREGEARHSGIHEARKCIRRTRATLALGGDALDQRAKRIDDELGRLCRGLSPLRDAQALIEALQRLRDSAPSAVRAILPDAEVAARRRRDQMLERALQRDPQLQARRQRLVAVHKRLLGLEWQAVSTKCLSKAVTRSKRRVLKARRRIEQHPDDDNAWHVFRRRLRRLRQQDSLMVEMQLDVGSGIDGLEHQAHVLGVSQDDALLLTHCGRRSPFPIDQRRLLRDIARERLQHARSK